MSDLDAATLADLAARVEAAEGPDRQIDRDLWLSFGWTEGGDADAAWRKQLPMAPTEIVGGYTMAAAIAKFPHDRWIADHWRALRFTEGLDAALALVERVLPGRVSEILHAAWRSLAHERHLHVLRWDPERDGAYAPALARHVLSALLAALAKQSDGRGG